MTTQTSSDNHRILVVDDNRAIHQDFIKIFSAAPENELALAASRAALFGGTTAIRQAFEIDSAYQGQEALDLVMAALAQNRPYAMAFVDSRMPPGWDGIETTARIWKQDPDIQVVICTAYSDYSWGEMLAKLGHSDRLLILKKPFEAIEALQLASALTEKWRLARQSRSMLEDLERRVAERTRELVEAGARLQASEAQYRLLFDVNPHPMWVYDLESLRFVTVNGAAVDHYGYSEREFLAMTIGEIRPEEDIAALEMSVVELRRQGKHFGVWRHRKRDGSLIDVEISSDRIEFNGRPARLVLAHDVTERRRTEIRIERLNRITTVLSAINTLIVRARSRDELFRESCRLAVEKGGFRVAWIGLLEGRDVRPVAWWGTEARHLEGLSISLDPDGVNGNTVAARAMRESKAVFCNDVATDPAVAEWRELLQGMGVASLVAHPLLVRGQAAGCLILYAADPGFFTDEELKLLAELAGDISYSMEFIAREEKLDYIAFYDPVTRLANRALFLERLAHFTGTARETRGKLAVMLVDLERFRAVNDSFGRAGGDEVLQLIAARFTIAAGGATNVARVGGDQFAIVISGLKTPEDLTQTLQDSVWQHLGGPIDVAGRELRLSTRIGISIFPDDGEDAEALLHNAEAALKLAKGGDERFLFYTQEMTTAIKEKHSVEGKLRQALERDEFVLHYQPKVNIRSGAICGVEALLRWNSPDFGLVPPAHFIPVLEETGLIVEVGRRVLREAANTYRRWLLEGLRPPPIAVNVSVLQLKQRDFVASLREAISTAAGEIACIELEITESMLLADIESTMQMLTRVRDMGVPISIDDFGTGYSSLSYLSKLPIQAIKIDRSFVINMTDSADTMAIVSTIISLAHSLGLTVIAEGVDSEEQLKFLRLLKCDEMQGFLYSKGLPADEFAALLHQDKCAQAVAGLESRPLQKALVQPG